MNDIEKQELDAICAEIRSYNTDTEYWIKKQYGTELEDTCLRTLLIALRNLKEGN